MTSLASSLSLGTTSAASSLTVKATQLFTDIQSTLGRRNAIVRHIIHGHQLEATLLTEPTKCSHCNQMIWGLLGQQCKSCKLVSHRKCLNSIESMCITNLESHKLDRLLTHSFETKTFLTPTWCDHCGTFIFGMFKQGLECSSCLRSVHPGCVRLVPRACHPRSFISQKDLNTSTSYTHQSKISIDDFKIVRLLGTGSFSKVYLARLQHDDTTEEFAIKVIKKTNLVISSDPESIFTEWKVLNLGRNYRFLTIGHCCFQSRDRLYFVMEHVIGKDLVYHIRKERKFTEDRARFHSAEIVLALMYLHKQRVIYRDLKLDNIILDKSGHCKLLDFGMSKILENGQKTRTFCGTPSYISPEIIRGEGYDYSVDWWSLGVLMFEMLIGFSPFEGETEDGIYESIRNRDVHFPPFLSDRARSILEGLLTKEPQKRLGCQLMEGGEDAIRQHPFFLFNINDVTVLEAYQWEAIENQNIKPPYIPTQFDLHETDVEHETVHMTPIDSDELKDISQADFENFSHYSESFKDLQFRE